jgi:isopentenyl diphosphate isomerase/L-lactate dehydrogenase-like FMN-dependent dehydrogenase
MTISKAHCRREFLKFVAGSPVIASIGGMAAFLAEGGIEAQEPNSPASQTAAPSDLISDPSQALDVFDFEEPAHRRILPGHWAHLAGGVDGDATVRANREGFNQFYLRPHRLRDVSKVNMKTTIFGTTYDSPIFTCPTGGQRNIWLPDGELSVSRAAKTRNAMQMLDSSASESVEDCCAALGRPVVQQIYAPAAFSNCEILLKRLEAAGVTTIDLTVDAAGGRNAETEERLVPKDLTTCTPCHKPPAGNAHIMDKGFDPKAPGNPFDWTYVDRMRQAWKGKFGIKGIVTVEDASLCIKHGIDFVHVSNHGGRATETFRSTIATLPEIIKEVNGRVPVYVDGGFRRGTDVFKALAMGAAAVGMGRPVLWGLGAFGQPGVERVLEIVNRELRITMGSCGCPKIDDINQDYVARLEWPDNYLSPSEHLPQH